MISFKKYLRENSEMLFVSQQDKARFDAAIQPYTYTVKSTTNNKTVLVVRSQKNDRDSVKKNIEQKLDKANIDYKLSTTGGSVGSTIVKLGSKEVQITFKPTSGGMSETTLNSTITELVPSLAFMSKKKFSNINDLYDFISETDGKLKAVQIEQGPDGPPNPQRALICIAQLLSLQLNPWKLLLDLQLDGAGTGTTDPQLGAYIKDCISIKLKVW